jgi:hypothetical protein
MIIVQTKKFIPGFAGLCVCPFIFELLVIPFFIIYFIEFIFNCFRFLNFYKAYRRVSFEVEAYRFERDEDYLKHRSLFEQWA